ncbi:hypothetical protein Pint_26873 [Pistacia integerrima]|uniref:Uncharacterized protein n=1 Tax=Pistacia integerrima TaxID=434235 RepID=A0ACC0YQE4_9ROSI|nr:hypothetical protein Pint_26873 [Pistacia integerrima]
MITPSSLAKVCEDGGGKEEEDEDDIVVIDLQREVNLHMEVDGSVELCSAHKHTEKEMASKTNNKGVAHFFKQFLPKHGCDGFKIPDAFVKYLNGFPKKAVLQNRMGKRWHVEIAYTDSMVLFANGWQKFVKDNSVEPAESLVFSYDGDHIFYVLIFEKCGCERKENSANVSIDMEVKMEEKEEEDDKVVIDVDDECGGANNDNYEDCIKEEEATNRNCRGKKTSWNNGGSKRRAAVNAGLHEGVGAVPYFMSKNNGYRKNHLKRETRPYVSYMKVKMEEREDGGENDGDGDYIKEEGGEEEKDTKEEEEATNRKRRGKKPGGNNVDSGGSKRRAAVNARLHEGVDVVSHVQPQNPYFMSKWYKKQYLNVPSKVLKDFKLELAENIFFHDELDRKWPGKVFNWMDGRTVIHGWATFCRWNHVKKDDVCICEFLQTEGNVQDIIKVHIIRSSGSRS